MAALKFLNWLYPDKPDSGAAAGESEQLHTSKAKQLSLDIGSGSPSVVQRAAADLDIGEFDATFRDSARAPMHSWFPYLEGYSPRFVERVRTNFLPSAKRIIEPFAGSGTTPIVLAQVGLECAFAEANPAMALLVESKLKILALDDKHRRLLSSSLYSFANAIARMAAECSPDESLANTYQETFGKSIFFREHIFEEVLRLRTLTERLEREDPLGSVCLQLAILASLVPSSLLIRAGDLRFRTASEIQKDEPSLVELVRQHLFLQAADIPNLPPLRGKTYFATGSAAKLREKIIGEWDGVITSPPYLNGTNYIRNARLELWFLRFIRSKADLRRLRDEVVTSAINDVTMAKPCSPVTAGVAEVVEKLNKENYDGRIPRMVGSYFHDMREVIIALKESMRNGGRICIDIGDSIYGGIHVPTDNLLVELAEDVGLQTIERVDLRKRYSKKGALIRQQLLVFGNQQRRVSRLAMQAPPREESPQHGSWRLKWQSFKNELPHQQLPYSKREWGGAIHSMCSYQGKIKPALAYHLVEAFSEPGQIVVDPFSGAGTIPYEASKAGRRGFGIDISNLGYVLTAGKLARPDAKRLQSLLGELEDHIAKAQPPDEAYTSAAAVNFNSSIPEFFHPATLKEVLAAREFFLGRWDSGAEWALAFASTLHLLHGNRPYALSRRSHPVTPFKPTGDFEYRALMPRLKEKLQRIRDAIVPIGDGGSFQADSTKSWPNSIPKADVIITSPPFFDSTRFYMTNWMRFWFTGWERLDFEREALGFLENRQKKNLDVYIDFFNAARSHLTNGGRLILHLGFSRKCDMGAELSKRALQWFNVEDCYTECVRHCETHGLTDKGAVTGHSYLVLSAR